MAKLDNPSAGADKWEAAMQTAGPAFEAGVRGVTQAPGAKAAAASAKYLARVQANLAKFERNVASIDLPTWQNLTVTKGATRLGTGATAAKSKMVAFNTAFYAWLKQNQARIDAMPTNTLAESKAKAMAQIDVNAAFPGYR